MRDVRVGHEQIVIADARDALDRATVPRLMVQYSRITLRSPISRRVGSPAYFLSCGASPIEANWKILLSAPIVVWPLITTCGPIQRARADHHVGADDAEGTHLDVGGQLRAGRHDRARIDHGSSAAGGCAGALLEIRRDHDLRVRDLLAADLGGGGELPDALEAALEARHQDQLIAGLDRLAEARLVDADEIEARVRIWQHVGAEEGQQPRHLRQRLDDDAPPASPGGAGNAR